MAVYESQLHNVLSALNTKENNGLVRSGKIHRAVGLTLEAQGFYQPIGSLCLVEISKAHYVEAEVVGFDHQYTYLMSIGHTRGISPGMRVIPTGQISQVKVGYELLGRIISGTGKPLDEVGYLELHASWPLHGYPVNPLHRALIDSPLDVGVRAINALLTVGMGQRLGLFAGSGVGKSVLLSMMTKFTNADIVVVGLIGERGREVKEFIEFNLGEEGLKRAIIIASPADDTPLLRLHGALAATSIAEYFRDQGKNVLLLMDSLTRFAQAQREIALSIGEPPATKGYPPSVFSQLPLLIERAGRGKPGGGSITAFYTVLVEGDDHNDPIADAARAILDGHIVLSRELAESGQYPAIDLEASISRVMAQIMPIDHVQRVNALKKYLSLYEKNKDFILLGAYKTGTDKQLDKAIAIRQKITQFIQQNMNDRVGMEESLKALSELTGDLIGV